MPDMDLDLRAKVVKAFLALVTADDISDDFLHDADAMCQRLHAPTRGMLGLMLNESGLKATAHNSGGATGLIQWDVWAPDHKLLVAGEDGKRAEISVADLENLGDDGQLAFVEGFFEPYKGKLTSGGRLYGFCFIPARAMLLSWNPRLVMCGTRPQDPYPQFYKANPGFDTAKKGYIEAQDLENAIDRAWLTPRGKAVAARLAALQPPAVG